MMSFLRTIVIKYKLSPGDWAIVQVMGGELISS